MRTQHTHFGMTERPAGQRRLRMPRGRRSGRCDA